MFYPPVRKFDIQTLKKTLQNILYGTSVLQFAVLQ